MIPPGSACHLFEALGKDSLAGSFEGHYFTRIGTLGRGVFRMGAIDVETPPICQHLIQLTIVLNMGPLPFPFNLEATRIEQRVLILIVPDSQRGRQAWIGPADGDGVRDRVCSGRIA